MKAKASVANTWPMTCMMIISVPLVKPAKPKPAVRPSPSTSLPTWATDTRIYLRSREFHCLSASKMPSAATDTGMNHR